MNIANYNLNWSAYKYLLARRHHHLLHLIFLIGNSKLKMVSTRRHFNLHTGQLSLLHKIEDYDCFNIPGLNGNPCLDKNELIGVWAGLTAAKEQLDRTKLSLNANGYDIPVVGFSWDSNTVINPSGWDIAKSIAKQNGLKLAKFLSDFKANCPNCNIRIIAHSLGAKVVESALIRLNNNETWKNNSAYSITSIHLIGAAISDIATSKNTQFGSAIDNIVDNFYNLYNPKDNVLQRLYVKTENEIPLGLSGLNKEEPFPQNYMEHNVMSKIPLFKNASGIYQPFSDKAVYGWGDNHSGYIGFRERYPFNKSLKDDGDINVIVADWRTSNK